jgi:curved DNA-binding protein CbpA
MSTHVTPTREQQSAVDFILNEENCWKILQLEDIRSGNNCNEFIIKSAFKSIARQVHPDKNPSLLSTEAFQKLYNALLKALSLITSDTHVEVDNADEYDEWDWPSDDDVENDEEDADGEGHGEAEWKSEFIVKLDEQCWKCLLCNVDISKNHLERHIYGPNHRRRCQNVVQTKHTGKQPIKIFVCQLCENKPFYSSEMFMQHLIGKQHQSKVNQKSQSVKTKTAMMPPKMESTSRSAYSGAARRTKEEILRRNFLEQLNKDEARCWICSVVLVKLDETIDRHIEESIHQANLSSNLDSDGYFFCKKCNIQATNSAVFFEHLTGKKHSAV